VAENNPYEFYLMAPPGVTIIVTSMAHGRDPAVANPFRSGLEAAVRRLIDREVDVIVQAGVPATVSQGWGYDDEVRGWVAHLTERPFVTDVGASIDAMHTVGMARVALLTAFDEEVHDYQATYVKHAGIEIVAARTLRTSPAEYEKLAFLPLDVVYRAAKDVFSSAANADGIWIAGALMPSVGVIAPLEADLGVPVVTSMQAMTWASLRAVNIRNGIAGFGRLGAVG
jgi:maleate cis-trans isomerase